MVRAAAGHAGGQRVGAGDSFVAGLVWAWQHGMPMDQAFAWGVTAGSAVLLTAGTGLARPDDVQRLFAQVQAVA